MLGGSWVGVGFLAGCNGEAQVGVWKRVLGMVVRGSSDRS